MPGYLELAFNMSNDSLHRDLAQQLQLNGKLVHLAEAPAAVQKHVAALTELWEVQARVQDGARVRLRHSATCYLRPGVNLWCLSVHNSDEDDPEEDAYGGYDFLIKEDEYLAYVEL